MPELAGRILSDEEVQNLYLEKAKEWFLLEVVETNEKGRAKTLRIVSHNPEKDVLREYILEDEQAENKRYIFYFSNPDLPCELD